MNIHAIQDLSNDYVVNILKLGLQDISESNIIENYSPLFSNINSNLFYILENGRYKNGSYYVLEENGKFVAASGWHGYTNDIALVLSRSYVAKEHRTTYVMGEYLLPLMIEGAKNYKNVWITCNEYNKAIYNWFYRTEQGKRPAMYANWPEIYSRFKPIGKKTVFYTEQYVAELEK